MQGISFNRHLINIPKTRVKKKCFWSFVLLSFYNAWPLLSMFFEEILHNFDSQDHGISLANSSVFFSFLHSIFGLACFSKVSLCNDPPASVRPCVRPSVQNLNRDIFSETIWPTVTKFGIVVVCDKGLKVIPHSATLKVKVAVTLRKGQNGDFFTKLDFSQSLWNIEAPNQVY